MNRDDGKGIRACRGRDRRRPAGRGWRPRVEALEARELLAVAIAEIPLLPPHAPTPTDVVGPPDPYDIVAGPDGNMWFTEEPHTIGRLTLDGTITEFTVPGKGNLRELTAGPDGNVWFLDNGAIDDNGPAPDLEPVGVKVGRITPDGLVTEFLIPGTDRSSLASGITKGPDGNVWVLLGDRVVRVTPEGGFTAFPLGGTHSTRDIISGPDGNLWFLLDENRLGTITPDGVVTVLPTPLTGHYIAHHGLAKGLDGNVWVAVNTALSGPSGNHVNVVTPDGTVTDQLLRPGITTSITFGPDGALWYTLGFQRGPAQIVGPGGPYTPPTQGPGFGDITTGPDGNIWFAESYGYASRIGQVDLDAPEPESLSVSGVPPIRMGASSIFQGQVATFTPRHPEDTPADYVAQIGWGDGKLSYGFIAPDGHGGMMVNGLLFFGLQVPDTIRVTIIDVRLGSPGARGVASSAVDFAERRLIPQPFDVTAFRGQDTLIRVAGAANLDPSGTYTATIDWGDGRTSAGVLAANYADGSAPSFTSRLMLSPERTAQGLIVAGTHAYSVDGTYTVRVSITDQRGLTTSIGSTLHYVSPAIGSAHTLDVEARAGTPTGTRDVASFVLPVSGVPASRFTATIDWGDGSPPAPGVVSDKVVPSAYVVQASHTFRRAGTYPFRVTISGLGWVVEVGGQARVTGGAPALTLGGGLDPASDTGLSAHDGITRETRPRFRGMATPGATVVLLAGQGGGSSPRVIGRAVAGASGSWSIVAAPLAEGAYAITADLTAADGRRLTRVPLATGGAGGRLVVDTSGPRVAGVVPNPATGQVLLGFADNLSQVDPRGLADRGAVRLSRVLPGGTREVPVRLTSIRPGGGSATFGPGRSLSSGRYTLQVDAGGVRDAAGNALDGEFRGVLPTGDGRPGGVFQAGFVIRGKTARLIRPGGRRG